MGGRPRTEGAKPPSAEGSEAPAKRSKAKASASAAAKPSKAAPASASTSGEAPRTGEAKAAGPAGAAASGPAARKARASSAAPTAAASGPAARKARSTAAAPAAEARPAEAAPQANAKPKGKPKAKAKEPAASAPEVEAGAPRKARGADAMALLDALRRAQGKPVTEVEAASAPADGEQEADDADTDSDADAVGEGAPRAAEVPRVPKAPPPFARTSGAPALGFPADKRPAPRWEFAASKPLALPLGVRSTGGVGRGVVVELSGAAVSEGLFEPSELVHDATRARFVRDSATGAFRATLADSAIPIGVQVPLSPPPRDEMQRYAARQLVASTHIELSIEGRGARVGTALLSVAARPARGSAAPLKWTRPITFK